MNNSETNFSWTDERCARIKELWKRGLSASQIAADVGAPSRNSVIGKLHRLRCKNTPREKSAFNKPKKEKIHKFSPAFRAEMVKQAQQVASREAAVAAAPPPEGGIHCRDLEWHHCRYVLGDPRRSIFCGAHKSGNKSQYCTVHASLVYKGIST